MKGNDISSRSGGSNGYGKRTLLMPEGAIQLNDRDNVIATTNPIEKGNDVSSISVSNSTTSRPPIDFNSLLLGEMKKSNSLKEEEMKKNRNVSTISVQ